MRAARRHPGGDVKVDYTRMEFEAEVPAGVANMGAVLYIEARMILSICSKPWSG